MERDGDECMVEPQCSRRGCYCSTGRGIDCGVVQWRERERERSVVQVAVLTGLLWRCGGWVSIRGECG